MTTMMATDPTALVGFIVFSSDGEELGAVEGVYLGTTDEPEWATVLVEGRFVIVPLADAEIYEDSIDVPFTAGEVRGAPLQQADLLEDLTEEQEEELLAYYTGDEAPDVRQAGAEVASTARDKGQEVAYAAKDHGQQVASSAKQEGQRVASTAKQQGQQVLRSGADQASEVVGTAKQQASEVVEAASVEARNLLEESRTRLEEQTAAGAQKLGQNLHRLGGEALALAEGRPDEAPTVESYVRRAGETLLDAADRAYGISDDVQTRGIGGLLDDVQTFARRRPGAFLLGTAVLGVMAGRAVRNAKADDDDEQAVPPLARSANGARSGSRPGTRGGR